VHYYPTWRRVALATALMVLAAAVVILCLVLRPGSHGSRADRVTVAGVGLTTSTSTVEPTTEHLVTTTEAPATTTSTTAPAPAPSSTVARSYSPTTTSAVLAPSLLHTGAPPPTTTPVAGSSDVWDRVHVCEGIAWTATGPTYEGGLGFTPQTWAAYGSAYASNAGHATEAEQKAVAERIMPGGPSWPGRYAADPRNWCVGYHGW